MRILFFLLHPGYVRYFEPLIAELSRRGHGVHVAFAHAALQEQDANLAERVARDNIGVTLGDAPRRPDNDGWRPLATFVRYLGDVARFCDPRFDDAPALRARANERLLEQLSIGPGLRVRRLARALARLVAKPRSARGTRQLVRTIAAIEQAIPTSPPTDAFICDQRPDVVLVSPLVEFGSPQLEAVKSGLRMGVPTGVAIASWDNLTSKGHLRVVPHRVFVWNEAQRTEAVELHGIPGERVVATGSQKFDEWFSRSPSTTHAAFAAKAGLATGRPFVLYLCSSGFIAPDEVSYVRDWVTWLRDAEDEVIRDLGVIVRPHPQNAAQWNEVALPNGAVIYPRDGSQPDGADARAAFFDAMYHAAAVVGVNTSALIEAGIVGRTVLSFADARFAATQEGTLHFRHLLAENGGLVRLARTRGEHFAHLAQTVRSADTTVEQTRAFIGRFVRPQGIGRSVAPILADAVEELAGLRVEPARSPFTSLPLRAVLALGARAAARTTALRKPLHR